MEMKTKLRGTVKAVKPEMGYMFVTDAATGEDYFAHKTAIERTSPVTWDDVQQGQSVEFTPITGPKGLRAIEVRVAA